MDWDDTAEQAQFRHEVRDFIRARLPAYYHRASEEGRDRGWRGGWRTDRVSPDRDVREAAAEWTQALGERGWVAPHWPAEFGGAGLSPWEQFILKAELARAGAPDDVGGTGVSLLGSTLIVHGSRDQQRRYLPDLLAGKVSWAQGFSEPGAGSDLASLQTQAVRDGDDYVLNGQKIWTSGAHLSDSMFALVRTDTDAPKHRGISFLLIDDIRAEGITIRPLLNMSWEHGFNEVFFEDVRVPANIVGEENRGWYVSMTLLDYERSNIGGAIAITRELTRLIAHVSGAAGPARAPVGAVTRAEITDRVIENAVATNFAFRVASMKAAGLVPSIESSIAKLFVSELTQRSARTGCRTLGLYTNVWDEDHRHAPLHAYFTHRYLSTVPNTIGGGTSEVQRNIVATRGLGLPRG